MKSKIHVFSRMFTKVNVFLFLLFSLLAVPSAWANNIYVSNNGESVVTPCTGSDEINIPKSVAAIVKTFVIYDNGGANGTYSNNCSGSTTIYAPEGYGIKAWGWMTAESADYLHITNTRPASAFFEERIADVYGSGVTSQQSFGPYYSTGDRMAVSFITDGSVVGPGFELHVEFVPLRTASAKEAQIWFFNPYSSWGSYVSSATTFFVYSTYSEGMTVPFTLNGNYNEERVWGLKVIRKDGKGTVAIKRNQNSSRYEFVMPPSDVNVIIKEEGDNDGFNLFNEERSLSVPSSKTLKVYDEGGLENPYDNNFDGWLSLSTAKGFYFKVTGTVETEPSTGNWDYLEIYEGEKSALGKLICKVYTEQGSSTSKVNVPSNCVSTAEYMTIHFRTDGSNVASGLDLTVSSVGNVYSVKVFNTDPHGSISSDVSSAESRSTVTVTATPHSGYVLKSVNVVNKTTGYGVSTYGDGTKDNKVTFTMPAADVEVTPVFVKDTYSITRKSVTGGSVSGVSSAKVGNTVTMTAYPSNGYLFNGVTVDQNGRSLSISGGKGFMNRTFSFTMPLGDVTVTPSFTNDWSVDGGLYINMPTTGKLSATIPAGVQSFKVYDDGGKSGYYSHNASGTLVLTAPSGYVLQLSGSMETYYSGDYLTVCDGSDTTKTKLMYQKYGSISSIGKLYSSGQSMTLYFHSIDGSALRSGLDLTVTLIPVENQIAYESVNSGGSVTESSPKKANIGATVSYAYSYTSGYLVRDIKIDAENGNAVEAIGGWYTNKTVSFKMPPSNVTVKSTYTNDLTADGGLYINMPKTGKISATIPAGVQSFKIYDDGGKNGNYSNNSSGTLVLTAPSGYYLQLSGSVNLYSLYTIQDYLTVCDGTDTTKTKLVDKLSGSSKDLGFVYSSGQSLTLYFNSDEYGGNSSGLDLTVNVMSYEKQITYKNTNDGGSVVASSPTKANYGSTVSYTYDYTSGYLVSDIKVVGENNYVVKASGGWYNNKKASFKMPPVNVTVKSTYTNDWSADGGLYIDMPKTGTVYATIPDGVKSFKVYDDGGKSGSYSMNSNGTLVLTAPTGYFFEMSGNISTAYTERSDKDYTYTCANDYLSVYNGTNTAAASLLSSKIGCTASSGSFLPVSVAAVSKGNTMTLNFKSGGTRAEAASGLDLMVKLRKLTPELADDGNGHKYVNTIVNHKVSLSIPAGVKSFNVYDNGGKDGDYLKGFNDTLVLSAPSGYAFDLTGNVMTGYESQAFFAPQDYTCNDKDNLSVYDGASSSATALWQNKTSDCSASEGPKETSLDRVISRGNTLTLIFKSNEKGVASDGFVLTVKLHKLALDLADDSDGNKYVNMVPSHKATLAIPKGVTSFKVYDDGGKSGNYMIGVNDTLVLTAPVGHVLQLTGTMLAGFVSWNFFTDIYTCNPNDNLSIYDGYSTTATALLLEKTCECTTYSGLKTATLPQFQSSGQSLTLVFKSNENKFSYDGLDLTVNVIPLDYAIQVNSAANGKVSASKTTKIHVGDTVSFVASANSGYMLKDIVAKDLSGNSVKISQYSFSVSELVMPAKDLIITPTFTNNLTAADGLHLDMRKNMNFAASIPSGVKSFNVYDNGGRDGSYEPNSEDTLTLAAPEGYRMILTGSVNMENNGWEYLYVYDGNSTKAQNLLSMTGSANKDNTTSSKSIGTVTSSDRYMTIRFKSDGSYNYGGLFLVVTLEKIKYTITVNQNSGKTLNVKEKDTLGAEIYLTGSDLFSNVSVVDKNNKSVKVTTYTFDRARFTMPASNVTVTPTWATDFTAEGGLHLDMLKNGNSKIYIPSKVKSFNLYDNGGKNGAYENNSNDILTLTAPDGFYLMVTGSMTLDKGGDSLYIFDGTSTSATKLFGGSSTTSGLAYSIPTKTSSGRSLTFRFKSNGSGTYSGLNLKVSVVPVSYAITIVNDNSQGTMTSDKEFATLDETVTLTATPADGYLFDGVSVEDNYGEIETLSEDIHWYSGVSENVVSFDMPASAVTVTPKFSAVNNLYVNMPKTGTVNVTVPLGVTSFKVYDDGGESGNYSNNSAGSLVLMAPEGYLLVLNGTVRVTGLSPSGVVSDNFTVYDGPSINSPILYFNAISNTATLTNVHSKGQSLMLHFTTDGSGVKDGLDLLVTMVPIPKAITIVNEDDSHGTMTSDKDIASLGETVTLTATPDEGYLFDGVVIKDLDGKTVKLVSSFDPDGKPISYMDNVHWYSNTNTAKFIMPSSAVTVTPVFTKLSDLYVNMPKNRTVEVHIPENVASFKVYDDGGKTFNYSNGASGTLELIPTDGWTLNVAGEATLMKGDVFKIKNAMMLTPKEGTPYLVPLDVLYENDGSPFGTKVDIEPQTVSQVAVVSLVSDDAGNAAGINLLVTKVKTAFGAVSVAYIKGDTFKELCNGCEKMGVIDGAYDGTDAVSITDDIDVDAVLYSRSFPANAYSTILLPFDVNTANIEGPDAVLRYNGIKDNSSIRMKVVWAKEKWVVANNIKDAKGNYKQYPDENLSANTPYLVQMGDATSKDDETVALKVNGAVTIKKTTDPSVTLDGWTFRGTWQYKKWVTGDPELGYAYGFAASASLTNNIKVGDFVKVGKGAWIRPMRAYLVKAELPKKAAQLARANGAYVKRPTVVPEELPELMSIVIDGDDDNEEHTTVIGHFNTRTGEFKMNYDRGKFDLKGRRVNGTNNARGAYYGKKVK